MQPISFRDALPPKEKNKLMLIRVGSCSPSSFLLLIFSHEMQRCIHMAVLAVPHLFQASDDNWEKGGRGMGSPATGARPTSMPSSLVIAPHHIIPAKSLVPFRPFAGSIRDQRGLGEQGPGRRNGPALHARARGPAQRYEQGFPGANNYGAGVLRAKPGRAAPGQPCVQGGP